MVTSKEVKDAREKLRRKHKKYLLMNQEKMDEIKFRSENKPIVKEIKELVEPIVRKREDGKCNT